MPEERISFDEYGRPFVRVKVCNPEKKVCVEEDFLIDTGANALLIPDDLAKKLDLNVMRKAFIRALNEDRLEAGLGLVELHFAGKTFLYNAAVMSTKCPPIIGADVIRATRCKIDLAEGKLVCEE